MRNPTVVIRSGRQQLALGLDWHPVIGGRPEGAARSLARRFRANHYVVAGSETASVGLAWLPNTLVRNGGPVYSAAQLFARGCTGGSYGQIYQIDDGRYWLVAAHEGAVITRADRLYSDLAQAHLALDELKKAYSQLELAPSHNGLSGHEGVSLNTVAGEAVGQPAMLPGWPGLDETPDTSCQLRRASWFTAKAWPLYRFLILACLGLAGWYGIDWVGSETVAPAPLALDERWRLWEKVSHEAAARVPLHGVHATHVLLQHLYTLPVQIAGWSLRTVDCTSGAGNWHCHARLDRVAAGAHNRLLLESIPKGWGVDFISIDAVRPFWTVEVPVQNLADSKVATETENQRVFQSALQLLKPALAEVVFGQPGLLSLEPVLDAQGQPLAIPSGFPRYSRRSLKIQAPLRTASLLLPHLAAIYWRQVTLSINETAHVSAGSSRLGLALVGDLYEIHETNNTASVAVASRSRR